MLGNTGSIRWRRSSLTLLAVLLVTGLAAARDKREEEAKPSHGHPVIWQDPGDIASRSLTYGSGGKDAQPQPPFNFVKEDLKGSNPKLVVTDAAGVKWKVKLGNEVRPEVVAARLIWAVGYFTSDDYYVPRLQVANLPRHLHRGNQYIQSDGSITVARLKRYPEGTKKTGDWDWRKNPFTGTRELNGLRVMMALVNNWDLKNVNNVILKAGPHSAEPGSMIYLVSDLGASFATNGFSWTKTESKGNLTSFYQSQFIKNATADYVDFGTPGRPALDHIVAIHNFASRINMEWIGSHVPRADAKWIGNLLAQLSQDQIVDAFLAAGYDNGEALAFARMLERRIAQLKEL